jgi:hypothetical protein
MLSTASDHGFKPSSGDHPNLRTTSNHHALYGPQVRTRQVYECLSSRILRNLTYKPQIQKERQEIYYAPNKAVPFEVCGPDKGRGSHWRRISMPIKSRSSVAHRIRIPSAVLGTKIPGRPDFVLDQGGLDTFID